MTFCQRCGIESRTDVCKPCIKFDDEQREIERQEIEQYMLDMEYYGSDYEPSLYDLDDAVEPFGDDLDISLDADWNAALDWCYLP